ncbi:hypothetical protein [Vulcanisaeta distributa]|uniref:hypothetical protein n=1 Tax=Vulcanisaeta distributa TaxID=164451 RepID=UPI000AA16C5B|nr:hypothetical protein [Vulcanisaeta distributa]
MNSTSVDHVIKEVINAIWKAQIRGLIAREYAVKLHELVMSLIGKNIVLEPGRSTSIRHL